MPRIGQTVTVLVNVARLSTRMCSSMTHYSLMGVGKNATKAEIKCAFLTLSKRHHPDLNPVSKSQHANQKFREINEAYSVLIDPAKRSVYDEQLYIKSQHSQFRGSASDERFGFYRPNPRNDAYTYARNYQYYDWSEEEWERLQRHRTGRTHKKHTNILRWVVLLMVTGTFLHSARIYYTQKNSQLKAWEASRKNQQLYEAVREKGRNSTVREQLDRLSAQHQDSILVQSTRKRDGEKPD